ncbi:MAG: site-specific DNA-methyltransferase [Microbacterium sp.]|uniref:site-specific DNA-methyltransferase n=1 Tax=Microbacterium sp. TaxID=51671 RepID=UPI001ACDBD3D|nr:site-specific DNA-methyltransferase [Microbacterium sp.]MBN9214170.1 site-specific DNA-methyltransferase [Microbacterium sp.]
MTSPLSLLLEQVDDPQLRARLTEQFDGLRSRQSYGLNFEEHADEAVRIPKARVTRKTTVQPISEPGPRVYGVRRITDGIATIVRPGEDPRDIPVADLVVARKLGDPVYMGLEPLGGVRRGDDKSAHVIIEGENYHALQTLLYTHEGKVDVIYIDPPYNTGAGDWIYNDKYVGEKDAYRHSKWLSFMDKRLRLAKRLLTPTGVIIVAIDDHEHHRLRVLMDDVFEEKNFISNVVWQGGRKNDSRYVSNGADYMLVYAKSADALSATGIRWRERKPGVDEAIEKAAELHDTLDPVQAAKAWRAWLRAEKKAGRISDAVSRYGQLHRDTGEPIRTDRDISWPGGGGPRYDVPHPVTGQPVVVPARGWIYSDPLRMQQEIDAGRVYFGPDHTTSPAAVGFLRELDTQVSESVFIRDRNGSAVYLGNVLGSKDFPFPKDVDVVARWVDIVAGGNKNAVVLDFFGGTGTTAEAVMRLNAQDDGRRQAILVTSNELAQKTAQQLTKNGFGPGDVEWEREGVYQKVTRPRLETVVTGIRRDGSRLTDAVVDAAGKKLASGIPGATGYDENVIFAKLSYLDRTDIELGRQFREIAPLLYMQAGGIGDMVAERPDTFTLTSQYAILADTDHRREFAEQVNASPVTHAYIVTDDAAQFQGVAAMLRDDINIHHLAEDYLVNFAINTGDVL